MIFRSLVILCFFPLNAWAWQSPEEAINQFLKYELNGGRLNGDNWKTYLSKYIVAPTGYDEPGFDMVTLVKSYKVSPLICENHQCSAVVTFALAKTKSTPDLPLFPHPNGGFEKLNVFPVKVSGEWRLKPVNGNPHILEANYEKMR